MDRNGPALPLAAAQAWLLGVVTHRDSVEAGIEARAEWVASGDAEGVVRSNSIASAVEHLEIYRSSYASRLWECLADDYPALQFALGEEEFDALCRRYVAGYPSHSTNLNGFGSRFAAFVRSRAAEAGHEFASELARLEWAIVEVLHAQATHAFSGDELARVPGEHLADVQFEANPAARLLSFEYPVNAYLRQVLQGEQPELPHREASTVLIVRRAYRIRRFEVLEPQSTLLGHLMSGEPLGRALSNVTASESAVQAWFREWTELGVFAGARVCT